MAAKVLREMSNLAKKRPAEISDLCEHLTEAMEAETVEECKDIITGAFDEIRVTLTEVLNCSRLFFVLRNVMRILGYPVTARKTIIPHIMELLFDDPQGKETLENALRRYRYFIELVSPPRNLPAATKSDGINLQSIHSVPQSAYPEGDNAHGSAFTTLESAGEDIAQLERQEKNSSAKRVLFSSPLHVDANRNVPSAFITAHNTARSRNTAINPSDHTPQSPMKNIAKTARNVSHLRPLSSADHLHSAKLKQNAAMLVSNMPKFSGSPKKGPALITTKSIFMAAVTQHKLSDVDDTDILYQCLEGDAQIFFFEHIQDKSCHIHAAFNMVWQRFDTHHALTQDRAYLNSIELADVRQKHNCDEAEALQLAQDQIVKTLLNCRKSLQGDDHRIFALQRVMQGEDWGSPILPLTGSANLTYADFHTALNTAVSAHLERTRRRNEAPAPSHGQDGPSAAITFYGSKYAMRTNPRPMPIRTKAPRRRLSDMPIRPGAPRSRRSAAELDALNSRTRCDYCRQFGHWRQECPTRRHSLTETVRARVRGKGHDNTALAEVLFEIADTEDA